MRSLSRACLLVACSFAASAALGQEATTEPVIQAVPTSEEQPSPASTSVETRSHGSRSRGHHGGHRATKSSRSRRRGSSRSTRSSASSARDVSPDGTSVSVGRHNRGRLVLGRELRESPVLRLKRPTSLQRFATDELIALLERAATTVATRTPGSRLTVGDLSMERGGRFRPHRSHQSGRDADVGFYIVDTAGTLLELPRFFAFRRDGSSRSDAGYRYDFVRNWQLVEALVTDTEAPVQWMFVSRELQVGLLAEAMRVGASEDTIARATAIMSQPRRGGAHRDHFHVRIYCPASDRPRCDDDPPFHPWVTGSATMTTTTTSAPPEGD